MKKIGSVIILIIITFLYSGCLVNKHSSFTQSKTLVQIDEKWKKAFQLEFRTSIQVSADKVWSEFKQKGFWIKMYQPRVRLKLQDSMLTSKRGNEEVYNLVINGFIPFGKHYVVWETIDDNSRMIQTREHGGYISNWDNHITIEKLNDSSCLIIDRLTLRGSILNKPTATWAKGVLNRRHKNLRTHFKIHIITPFTER